MCDHALPWLVLYAVPGLGPAAYRALLEHFETPENILSQSPKMLRNVPGIGPSTAQSICCNRDWAWARDQVARAKDIGLQICTLSDPLYPAILTQIYAPPPLLFAKGDMSLCHVPTISIVGSRSFTPYGRETAHRLGSDLGSAGVTVVSGMAVGIDTHAHRGALKHGATAAVLGSGLDCPYPPENRALFDQICERGVVLSEFPLGTAPEPHNFPRRNRIISGLSLGTVVVEAGTQSGALITAQFALDQNRDVFAVPGPIYSGKSQGTNGLLRQGAILVQTAQDILSEIEHQTTRLAQSPEQISLPSRSSDKCPTLSDREQRIWKAFADLSASEQADTPIHIDALARETGFSSGEALDILLGLEIQCHVEQLPGMHFKRQT